MGAVPKHKISSHRQGRRRHVISLNAIQTVICPNCSHPKPSHRACPHCGIYGKTATAPTPSHETKS